MINATILKELGSPAKKARRSGFTTEASLVDGFLATLASGQHEFGSLQITTEWDYRAGVVDVLARDSIDSLFAFEAKLTDWKRGFAQAYRNTAYANRVYVLLPKATVHRALRDREEFEYRGIGLCSFDGRRVQIEIAAEEQKLLLRWLREQAHQHFNGMLNENDPRPTESSS